MITSLLRTYKFVRGHPLGSRNKLGCLKRWFRWQLGSRLLRQRIIMPFVESSVLVVKTGMEGATGNIYCGMHEFTDMAFLLHLLRPTDIFADVGANVGSYTVLASKVVGATSHTFEPVPSTFENLRQNIEVNRLADVVNAYQGAVGAGPGNIRFSTDLDSTNHVVASDYSGSSMDVPVDSLDNLLETHPCVLWKIDVEGFEENVIQGAGKALLEPTLHAVLLESDSAEIDETMSKAGFQRSIYDPFTRGVRPLGPNDATGNHLWLRDLPWVQDRCKNARSFEVCGVKF